MTITAGQRARRANGIFSTDEARSQTGQRVAVYLEKIGEKEPDNLDQMENVQLGSLLEPAVIDAFAFHHEPGQSLVRSPDTRMHPKWEWLGCHPDAILNNIPVEAKAVGHYNQRLWGEPGTDQVPDRVLWQVQVQMAVLNAPYAWVPVAFATEANLAHFILTKEVEIRLYRVERSERLIEAIYDDSHDLWQCIQTRKLPAQQQVTDAALLYSYDRGTLLKATPELVGLHRTLVALRTGQDKVERRIADYVARIQQAMGAHAVLRHEGTDLVTWRRNRDSEILDAERVRERDPKLWAECLKTKRGARVFKVMNGHINETEGQ